MLQLIHLTGFGFVDGGGNGGGGGGGAAVYSAVGRANSPGTTGLQTISVASHDNWPAGTVPKAAMIFFQNGATDGVAYDDAIFSAGATDGTNQWSVFYRVDHGNSVPDTARASHSNRVIYMTNLSSFPSAQASFSSFVADGIEINWTGAANGAVTVWLFGGDDLQAWVNHFNTAGVGAANTQSPGFETDLVITSSVFQAFVSGASHSTGSAIWSMGFSTRYSGQCTHGTYHRSGQNEAHTSGTLRNDACIDMVSFDTSLIQRVIAENFTATTFDMRSLSSNSTGIGMLALGLSNGATAWSGVLDTPTSTGAQAYTAPAIQPSFAGLLGSTKTAVNTAVTDGQSFALGISGVAVDTGITVALSAEDNAASTNTQSVNDNIALYVDQDDGTTAHRATLTSFDPMGLTLNYSATLGSATKMPTFVIARSGDNGPAHDQLVNLATAAGAEALYDPDNPDTWILRDDGSDLWYQEIQDALGNRPALVQGTTTRQPRQVLLSTGRYGMEVGVGDELITVGAWPDISQPFTLLYVNRQTATSGTGRVVETDPYNGRVIHGAGGTDWQMFAGSGIDTNTPPRDTVFHHFQAVFNGVNSENIQDGVSIAAGDAGSSVLGGLTFGDRDAVGAITMVGGPMLVFTSDKTPAELSDIIDHLNVHWPIGKTS